jgi:hypothetical protein
MSFFISRSPVIARSSLVKQPNCIINLIHPPSGEKTVLTMILKTTTALSLTRKKPGLTTVSKTAVATQALNGLINTIRKILSGKARNTHLPQDLVLCYSNLRCPGEVLKFL